MARDNDVEQPSGSKDKPARTTPSAAKLRQIVGASPAPRNLTPYEVDLLRKAARETAEVVDEVLAEEKAARDQDETQATTEADEQQEESR